MTQNPSLTSFTINRWINAATTSDYPFLAVADDRSALLSLGNYGVGFGLGHPSGGCRLAGP